MIDVPSLPPTYMRYSNNQEAEGGQIPIEYYGGAINHVNMLCEATGRGKLMIPSHYMFGLKSTCTYIRICNAYG